MKIQCAYNIAADAITECQWVFAFLNLNVYLDQTSLVGKGNNWTQFYILNTNYKMGFVS